MDALTSLMHEDATLSMPPYDLWLRGRDDIFTLVVRAGHRLQRLAGHPDGRSERLARLRAVQAERDGERLRSMGAAGARDRGRADRRADVLPRHRSACSRCSGSRLASTNCVEARRKSGPLRGEYVLEAHERDEVEELARRVPQSYLTAMAARGDLQARERVDGHGVRLDAAHVAAGDRRGRCGEELADTVAQPREIGAGDGTVDRELDGSLHLGAHRRTDRPHAR